MNPDHIETPALAGLRPLTLEESRQRSESRACIDPDKRPGTSICSQSLWISLFFDGTGNNRFIDTPKSKHSNVARLYLAHDEENDSTGRYPIYVPGLGTPFREIGELTPGRWGLAFGSGGEKRLAWARQQFGKRIEKARARAHNPRHRIRMINVALFGFSRGAALARAFANRLEQECHQQGSGWTFLGYPIRLHFMGLFDTVSSVGLPASTKIVARNRSVEVPTLPIPPKYKAFDLQEGLLPKDGHYLWGKELKISAMVERCIHYVAAHEVRNSFPLDSVRDGLSYPSNCVEVVYPGVHSNVGGGYAPGEQTRSLADNEKLSQVPLLHMYRAARVAGVPLQAIEKMNEKVKATFELSAKTTALFDHYQQRAKASGALEKAFADHLYPLYLARSYLSKHSKHQAAWARLAEAKRVLEKTGNHDMVAEQETALKTIHAGGQQIDTASSEAFIKKRNGHQLNLREAALLRAHGDSSLMTESHSERQHLLDFFDYLVHDSVAGFGADRSKLHNWRMMYFGKSDYEPPNDWRLAEAPPSGDDMAGMV